MTPTFEQLGVWMVCGLFALDIWVKLRSAQKNEQPQKREVTFSTEFVRKGEMQLFGERLERVEENVDLIHKELRRDRDALMATDEQRASEIHKRINALSQEFNDKFQELPNQVVVLLKNTGAIN